MNFKLLLFLLIAIILNSSILCQEAHDDQSLQSDNFITSKLIRSIPEAVKNNAYFSGTENILEAKIYSNNNDTLYFFTKEDDINNPNCVLIYTSNNKIIAYNFLKFDKVDSNMFYSSGEIKLPNDKRSLIDFYYQPADEILKYKFILKNSSKSPITTAISDFETNYEANFEVGFRYEFSYMSSKILNGNHSYLSYYLLPIPLFNLHLTTGFRFLKNYKIDFRIGVKSIYEDFIGLEEGIFFQANLFNSKIFGTVGIDFFQNGGSAHGTSASGGDNMFYCIGVGYQTSDDFNIDIIYYFPDNKIYGHNIDVNSYPYKEYDKIVNNLISLGFQYSFIF